MKGASTAEHKMHTDVQIQTSLHKLRYHVEMCSPDMPSLRCFVFRRREPRKPAVNKVQAKRHCWEFIVPPSKSCMPLLISLYVCNICFCRGLRRKLKIKKEKGSCHKAAPRREVICQRSSIANDNLLLSGLTKRALWWENETRGLDSRPVNINIFYVSSVLPVRLLKKFELFLHSHGDVITLPLPDFCSHLCRTLMRVVSLFMASKRLDHESLNFFVAALSLWLSLLSNYSHILRGCSQCEKCCLGGHGVLSGHLKHFKVWALPFHRPLIQLMNLRYELNVILNT